MLASAYWGGLWHVPAAPTQSPPPPVASWPDSPAGKDAVHTIRDIAAWQHPVKDVLKKYQVQIHKVELHRNRTYPIFYVTFPFDPGLAHNNSYFKPLYYETLRANGFWDYSFVEEGSRCTIHISWDKKTKTMTEAIK